MLLGRRGAIDDDFIVGAQRTAILRRQVLEHVMGGNAALDSVVQQFDLDGGDLAEFNNFINDVVDELLTPVRLAEVGVRIFSLRRGAPVVQQVLESYGQHNLVNARFVTLADVAYLSWNLGAVPSDLATRIRAAVDQADQPPARMLVQGPYGVTAPLRGNVREENRGPYINARIPGMAPVPLNPDLPQDERADVVANMYAGIVRPRNQLREAQQFQSVLSRVSDEVENGLFRYKEDILAYKSNVVYAALNSLKRSFNANKIVWGSEPLQSLGGRHYIRLIQGAGPNILPIYPISFKIRSVGAPRRIGSKMNLVLMNGTTIPGGAVAEEDPQYPEAQRIATTAVIVIGKLGSASKREYSIAVAPYFGFADPMFTPLKSTIIAGDAVKAASGLGLVAAAELRLPSANAGSYDRLTVNVGGNTHEAGEPLPYFLPIMTAATLNFYQTIQTFLDEPITFRYSAASVAHQVTIRQILQDRIVGIVWSPPANQGRRTFVRFITGVYNNQGAMTIAPFELLQGQVVSRISIEGLATGLGSSTLVETPQMLYDAINGHHGNIFIPHRIKLVLAHRIEAFLTALSTLRRQFNDIRNSNPHHHVFNAFDPRQLVSNNAAIDRMWSVMSGLPDNYVAYLADPVNGILGNVGEGVLGVSQFIVQATALFTEPVWAALSTNSIPFRILRVPPNTLQAGAPPVEIRSPELFEQYLRARLTAQVNSIFAHYANGGLAQANVYPYRVPALVTDFQGDGQIKLWVEGFNNIADYLGYLQVMSWLRNFGYSRKQEKAKISKTRIAKFVGADSQSLRKMVETFGGDGSNIPGVRRGG